MIKRQIAFTAIAAAVTVLISNSVTASAQDADAKLGSLFKTYLDDHLRQQPLEATQLGEHRFDNQLDDITPPARADWLPPPRKTPKELSPQGGYTKISPHGPTCFVIFHYE